MFQSKIFLATIFVAGVSLSGVAAASDSGTNEAGIMGADAIWHDGRFSSVSVTGEGCEDIFAVDSYEAQHFLVGPTGRTSVIHLRDRSGAPTDKLGFFDGISFIGLYGGSGDVYVDRDISRTGNVYKAHLEGMLDRRVIFVQISVKRVVENQVLCEASADFTGFN